MRKLTRDPVNGDLITLDYKHAEITRASARCSTTRASSRSRRRSSRKPTSTRCREHGLRDEDIWDVIEIAAMFNFTNRVAHATGMLPNAEYHAMAR